MRSDQLAQVERTRQFLVLKAELEKQRRMPMQLKPNRRDVKSDSASKALAMWQKKDLLARTARDVAAPEQAVVKGSQYIPEVVEVCLSCIGPECCLIAAQAKFSSAVSMHGYLNIWESHELGSRLRYRCHTLHS